MRFVITRRESFNLADGINAFIFALSDALIDSGHEVFLISASLSSEERVQSNFESSRHTKIFSLSKNETPKHKDIVTSWRKAGIALVKNIKPDFIIVNGALPLRFPFPSCTVSHDLERRFSYGEFIRRSYKMLAYRRSDKVVATCSELAVALAKQIMVARQSVAVIPTCADLGRYTNEPLEQREPAILHMGMPAYKNPTASIQGFAALTCPASLYLTGRPSTEVQELIASLPREKQENIHLVGIVSAEELKRLLSHVRVLSVPSDYVVPVASPTVIDGLASGTPVIGTPGITADMIVDGESGFRISPHDISAITSKLELLLTNDEVWRSLSKGALARAASYDNHLVAQAYVNLAQGMIA